jgi:hypothetical protein
VAESVILNKYRHHGTIFSLNAFLAYNLLNDTISSLHHRERNSRLYCNSLASYLEGGRFESRQSHWFSWYGLLSFWDITSIRPGPLPSKLFLIQHSSTVVASDSVVKWTTDRDVRFQVLNTVNMKITFLFCSVKPYSLVDNNQRFRWICYLYLQDRKPKKPCTTSHAHRPDIIFKLSLEHKAQLC